MKGWVVFAAFGLAAIGSAQFDLRIDWSVLRSGSNGKLASERTAVLSSEGEFQIFWSQLTGQSVTTTPSGVDWGRQWVVAITLGQGRSAGSAVEVLSITREGIATVRVRYREVLPNGPKLPGSSAPWVVFKMDRTPFNLEFEKGEPFVGGREDSQGVPWQVRWSTFMAEDTCTVVYERVQAITNRQDFAQYWKNVMGGSTTPRDVDFDQESLIAIHLGRRTTSGYYVSVNSIRPSRRGLVVTYTERVPSEGQRVSEGRYSPFVIVRVPKFEGDVDSDKRTDHGTWRDR